MDHQRPVATLGTPNHLGRIEGERRSGLDPLRSIRRRHALRTVASTLAARSSSQSVERSVERRSWHRSQKINKVVDGWFEFEMNCEPSFEVKTWILSGGNKAVVAEPAALRLDVIADLQASLRNYPRG